MALAPGTRLGAYEIVAALGAGGMGEVYRATDLTLKRQVAIKVLPAALSGNPERLARFQREAELLAAIDHPRIAAIHGLERSDGIHAIVMELVEGEDLATLIARGALPLADAVAVAQQIADALEAAHEQGIVHRDLKPANVRVRSDGSVKILDFGLAKVLPTADAEGADTQTVTHASLTDQHTLLGTIAYMSPEQLSGRPGSRRGDIWAFGCVLYEMLTGTRPFQGRATGDIMAAVLRAEPDWRQLPADTPIAVRRLLERCLRKAPASRLRHIGDARLELEDPAVAAAAPLATTTSPIRRWLPWAAAALAAVIAVAAVVRRPPVPAEVRLEFSTPPTMEPALAISPDGRTVAFVSLIDGRRQMSLRRLDDAEARQLPGTDNAIAPFWSPDGRSIGFFADGRLNLASLETGTVQALVSGLAAPNGATLSGDNVLLYSGNPGSPLSRLSIPGGTPTAATQLQAGHRQHASPSFLPDGRHFLFFVSTQSDDRGIHVGQLDSLESRHLLDSDGAAVFSAASGCLFFVRDGKLVAQRFDPDRLALGPDVIAVDPRGSGALSLAASPTGALVYRPPTPANDRRQLAWLDRSGTETHRVIYRDTVPLGPALSRDGRKVAVFRYTDDNVDLWNYDVVRGTWDRLTFDAGDDIYPLWSSDGGRLIFGSRRGTMDLYSLTLGGGPATERLELRTQQPKFPTDWSPDDRLVLFNTIGPESGVDIAALHLDGTHQSFDVVKTPANEQHAQFSPDGRWIAYQSDKTGRDEIYLRPYPGPGADVPVSTNGGSQARWNPRGEELFYIAADDRLMSVPLHGRAGQLEPGAATALFLTTVGSTAPNTNRQQYSVAADGRTFLMNGLVEPARSSPVTVLLNWRAPQ